MTPANSPPPSAPPPSDSATAQTSSGSAAKKKEDEKPGFWASLFGCIGTWVLPAFVILLAPLGVYRCSGWLDSQWIWETRVPSQTRGVNIHVHSDMTRLELRLYKPQDPEALRLRVAADDSAQRSAVTGAPNKPAGLECAYLGKRPKGDGKQPERAAPLAEPTLALGEKSKLRCELSVEDQDLWVRLDLELDAEDRQTEMISLRLIPFSTAKLTDRESADRLNWSPTVLQWSETKWRTRDVAPGVADAAKGNDPDTRQGNTTDAAKEGDPARTPDAGAARSSGGEASAKSSECASTAVHANDCQIAHEVLRVRDEVLVGDAQASISSWVADRLAKEWVPRIVGWMVGVLVALALLLLGLIALLFVSAAVSWVPEKAIESWYKPKINAFKSKIPQVLPLEDFGRFWRYLLEILEVLGPALGFLLTVCSLLIAFNPSVFVDRDMNRFGSAISMGMTATAAGLGIRVLAFLHDRLFQMLSRVDGKEYKVDPFDLVHKIHSGTDDKGGTDGETGTEDKNGPNQGGGTS